MKQDEILKQFWKNNNRDVYKRQEYQESLKSSNEERYI